MDLLKHLKTESVSRLNPTAPWQVHPTQPVQDAVRLMKDKKVGCVLVCVDRRVVGIFTERDLMKRVLARNQALTMPVGDVMTLDPAAVQPKEPIAHAIRVMQKGGYRHLPVVVDGKPIGILSVRKIMHYLVEHFPATVYNLPPLPQHGTTRREGA